MEQNVKKYRLSSPDGQLDFFKNDRSCISFSDKIKQHGLFPLIREEIEIFQINVGKMCNQVCKHCHVDAGPGRKEIMSQETMNHCLEIIEKFGIKQIDLTGGAPEMNPNFKWFVEKVVELDCKVMVRCNLTILVESKKYAYLPSFFRKNNIHIISSLPYFMAKRTDSQRGEGVFEKSIRALQLLNGEGYGIDEGLELDLVYNPSGAFLPPDQKSLEDQFKLKLFKGYNIVFNKLLAITNLPVSRFLNYLVSNNKYEEYMQELVGAFNSKTVENVMCKNTLSVSWDGYLYDCDFNQMLDLKMGDSKPFHVSKLNWSNIKGRKIEVNKHCFGCTAGAGSSCGGSTV